MTQPTKGKIADLMTEHGSDRQRGGCYDVVERIVPEGEKFHRFVWHDRKPWWQQEQMILAYFILAGVLDDNDYHKLATEASAFYLNASRIPHPLREQDGDECEPTNKLPIGIHIV